MFLLCPDIHRCHKKQVRVCVCFALGWRAYMGLLAWSKVGDMICADIQYPFSFCSLSFPLFFILSWLLLVTELLPPFVISSSSPYLTPCSPNPPVQALSWIKLSPILSLYGRIYSSTSSYPPFSTLTVASTVARPCSLESIKFSCAIEGNPRRSLKSPNDR